MITQNWKFKSWSRIFSLNGNKCPDRISKYDELLKYSQQLQLQPHRQELWSIQQHQTQLSATSVIAIYGQFNDPLMSKKYLRLVQWDLDSG